MGNRISKVVTRTGDAGETGLANGRRVGKDCLRIHAIGEVDELNSMIGLVVCKSLCEEVKTQLQQVQNDLFGLGGELAGSGNILLGKNQVLRIENAVLYFNRDLSPLKEFVLPGGSEEASLLHLARSICRRAERSVVALGKEENISPVPVQYLNRLSDLLFVMARLANKLANHPDVFWKKDDYSNRLSNSIQA